MGLFDMFLAKDKRDVRARERHGKRAVDKYAQSGDRWKSLEALAKDGSDDALFALMRRFGLLYEKSIEDEQEKEWVFETLVSKGVAVLPALKRYLLAAESVSWPLRILDKVADPDTEMTVLENVLSRHEPGYERDPTKKTQVIAHLAGMKHDKAAALIAPYLKDMDEGVRFTATEGLVRHKNESVAAVPMCELFASDDEESLRIRLRIADVFVAEGWAVPDEWREGVGAKLPDAYAMDRQGRFKKK